MKAITKDTQTSILKEQFIPDHVFLYIAKGAIRFFDGNKSYALKAGDCCIARKNRLAKFVLTDSTEGFEPVLFCFDEPFLRAFLQKHKTASIPFKPEDSFIQLSNTAWIGDFILSLKPYYKGVMQLEAAVEDLKYEELLIILLKNQPELAGIFFDFGMPEKINLEAFMNRNFKFNISIQRFAYMTGRSISAFKRDFKTIFNDTPGRWLIQKRLQEAYFLINEKHKKPAEIYIELGFETLSHFSAAFKKRFKITPAQLIDPKKNAGRL